MRKFYFLLFFLISLLSYGQILSDDFNYADNALLTTNGWTAHSGAGSQPIDVGVSNGLTYAGYSGTTGFTGAAIGNAVRLDNTGEDVNKAFASAVTSGDLYVSFLINVTTAVDGYFFSLGTGASTFFSKLWAKPSSNSGKINFGISNGSTATYSTTDFDINTTYLVIMKYGVSTSGPMSLWILSTGVPTTEVAAGAPLLTASGSGGASVAGVYLRQYSATQNITIDGLRVYSTWFGATPCSLSLGAETTTCNATTFSVDTYSVSIPFTGGGTATYNLSTTAGTISGDNPSSSTTGNIIISGINEGTNVTLNVAGACTFSKMITAPECKPTNTLPAIESFNYTVGTTLNNSQMWTNTSVGSDEITTVSGNLTYTGITSTGNSVSFAGTGSDTRLPFTNTTSGELYSSFLVKVTDLTGISTTGNTYFAALSDAANVFTVARLYFKTNGTQFQYGISPTTTVTDIVWSPNLYAVGSTQFLVFKYDFANNSLVLVENPTIGSSLTPTVSVTPTTPITSLANFILRQDTATTTPAMIVDELKISSTSPTLATIDLSKNRKAFLKNSLVDTTIYFQSKDVTNLKVYSADGKLVKAVKVSGESLDVSSLPKGNYIVTGELNGEKVSQKILKK